MTTKDKIQEILDKSTCGKVNMKEYIHDICHIILLDETLSDKEKMVLFAKSLLDLEGYSGCPIADECRYIADYVED